MKTSKKILILVFVSTVLFSCSQKKLVSTQINYMQPYCGGARPTPEIIADAEKSKPYANKTIVIVSAKGKVPPGKYRAYGYKAPPHLWNEIKTGLRAFRLRFGKAPANSSAQKQIDLKLNRNTTLHPKKTEGEKLREQ